MSDVMQLARVRREELAKDLSKHQAEIGKIREDIEYLDAFIALGEELTRSAFPQPDESSAPGSDDEASQTNAPLVMPVRRAQPA